MNQIRKTQYLRKRKVRFNPGRCYVNDAVEDYLKRGGVISKIVPGQNNYPGFMGNGTDMQDVDDFLMGI